MHPTISCAPHYRRAPAERPAHQRRQPPQLGGAASLPQELSGFVGSRAQISSVVVELRSSRMVTLAGAGGIGKTRLVLQAARDVQSDFERCVWVPLGATVHPVEVVEQLARALGGGRASSSTDVETRAAGLGSHQLLLVLDNCEHLIAACADLAMRLLQGCPGVRIVATSREPLGVPGEVVYRVEPLSWPPEDESLENQAQSDAVCLFLERARAGGATLKPGDETRASVAAICRTLQGVPLAIELAAARTSSMSVSEIAARLNDDLLGVLAVGARALPPRQQSLRGSLDWSHVLLPA